MCHNGCRDFRLVWHVYTRSFEMTFRCWTALLVVSALGASAQQSVDGMAPQVPGSPQSGIQEQGKDRGFGFVEPRPGDLGIFRGGWYLGVYGRYTTTGLVLTEVYPRTAAARVGLERGDTIIAVNGRQIGMRYGSIYRLDVALQEQASQSGWVRLLVQDRRTMRLVTVNVRLTYGRIHT